MAILRGLYSLTNRGLKLAGLLALLAGIPYGLSTQVGPVWPTTRPTLDGLGDLLGSPMTDSTVVHVLAGLLWLLWLCFAICVINELIATVRGTPRLPLGPLGPMQFMVSWLVTGITAGTIAVSPFAAVAQPTPAAAHHAVAVTNISSTRSDSTANGALRMTAAVPVAVVVNGQHYTYTVKHGDYLSRIARDWLGDANRWHEIYDLNQGRHFPKVGGTLTNPNLIYPGWTLYLPDDAHPPASADPKPTPAGNNDPGQVCPPGGGTTGTGPTATPTPTSTAPATNSPTPGATPTPTGSPTTTNPTPAATGAIVVPSQHTPTLANSPSGSTVPPSPTPTSDHSAGPTGQPTTAPHANRTSHGIALPGGWISIAFGSALTAAFGLVWLQRRRRYQPAPLAAAATIDPDLRPLPPATALIRRAIRSHAPELDHHDTPAPPTVAQYNADPDPANLPPTGPDGLALAGIADDIPPGGLGLAGDGADAAARAMLVATLSSGSSDDPDARGSVIIPVDALTTLLGANAVEIGTLPRLTVTANLAEALTRAEEAIIERRRLLEDYGVDAVADLRDEDPYHPPVPPLLLIAEAPDTDGRARLTSTIFLGAPLHISTVLLGDWPRGDTLTIDQDGQVDDDPDRQIAVLDVPTTIQLLQILREAHTGEPTVDLRQPIEPAHSGAEPAANGATADSTATVETQIAGRVRLRTMGQPAVLDDDGTPVPGMRGYARQLMVYLALHRRGATFGDIMAAFWPDAHLDPARDRLSTEVGDLRRTIRKAAGDDTIRPVLNLGRRYQLDPELVDVDLWRFGRAMSAAAAANRDDERVRALEQAVAAHTELLADGQDWDWIESAREQHRRHGVQARIRLAELIADTQPQRADKLADDAIRLDPYNEAIAQAAMKLHAACGNIGGVRATLHKLETALGELDAEPRDETVQLAKDLAATIRHASSDDAG